MAIDPKKNVGRKIPGLPYGESRKSTAVLFIPVVEGGEVVGYLPAKGTDNSDGTATLNTSGGGGAGVDPVGLKNIADTKIDPSTEGTLATRASEATLLTRATEATLAIIKDAVIEGVAEHHNGTATTTPANVAFSGTSKAILIENLDVAGSLLVSFDGGTNTKTIGPGQTLSVEANHTSVEIASSALTIPYEMLVTV